MEYEIIEYDVWGNKVDGYEVNNAFRTGNMVEIDIDNDSDKTIIKKLKDAGYLAKGLHTTSFEIDGDEYGLYVNCVKQEFNGFYPVCELRPN